MAHKRSKFVKFVDWDSDTEDGSCLATGKLVVNQVVNRLQRGFKKRGEKLKTAQKVSKLSVVRNKLVKVFKTKEEILDPQEPFLQKLNVFFVAVCVLGVSFDPLFFYIPLLNHGESCLDLDGDMEIVACVLRTFFDALYVLHIICQFHTGFIAPTSRVFGRGQLVKDRTAIARRYLFYFIVDVLAILPIPQLVILLIVPNVNKPEPLVTNEALKWVIFSQYIFRLVRIYPLYQEIKRTSGTFFETAWAGAAMNLFLYMLASHVLGSLWYLLSIERKHRCWTDASKAHNRSDTNYLYCTKSADPTITPTFLGVDCQLKDPDSETGPSTYFDFGIFLPALQSGVTDDKDFSKKFLYCFWWGLRNLSSLGQNLSTSTFEGEICFAVFIAVTGLILFSLIIGNMQKYLMSTSVRVEEMRVQRQDAERWMSHRMLPENLRDRIRRYEQYKWQETRGVEEDTLIRSLPKDIRRDVKRHLCLNLLMRVPMFEKMDDQLLDAMCARLKPVLYTEKSIITREGDPVEEMIFIMRGNLETMTTDGGRSGFFNSVNLTEGDFCGDELLTWALDPNSSHNLPTSTRTVQVKAQSEVEAFALMADDLKSVASQYRRLHSKQLQHTFKYYSQQWKTWAACFIQAAWRRHWRRTLEKALKEQEEGELQNALANELGSPTSLGSTIRASRFAANILKTVRNNGSEHVRLSPRLPPMLPQKPAEPDFSKTDQR
uniref:Cyclic nucleotide-binding domain-containing protein n=1 Tax=Kalanchoe fedtschenkoi TaxID=63787 RepID=A0A7N0UFG1_KALFE